MESGVGVTRLKLIDIVDLAYTFDDQATIYAKKEWDGQSDAVVDFEPDDGSLPISARSIGATYFLEVSILLDVIEFYNKTAKTIALIDCVIYYAKYDAFPSGLT